MLTALYQRILIKYIRPAEAYAFLRRVLFPFQMPNLLGLIDSLPGSGAIVIRHAQRHEICGAEGYWTCGLTDIGIEQARRFGQSLAGKFGSYRIFHSPVKRCEQTALAVSEELGVERVHPEKALGVSYIRVSVEEGFAEADRHGNNFIRSWFDGQVPSRVFMPLPEAKEMQVAYLRTKLAEAPPGTLDIHVTHDWNINVLREGIFGLRHEDVGWPEFLSGLVFSKSSDGLWAMINEDGKLRIKEL
jgi:hypothetical protein